MNLELWSPPEDIDPRALGELEDALARRLAAVAQAHARAALASSLSAEDMVITEAIVRLRLPISIFVIDTGRLHAETLELMRQVQAFYGIALEVWRPRGEAVADFLVRHGRDAFYESRSLRIACCHLRKVEPLARALAGREAWLSGQRRAQDGGRAGLKLEEFDSRHGLAKYNPLADWPDAAVWAVAARRAIPLNPLHRCGYPSLGCAPCTRAVRAGEDPRAGRWWWESSAGKECGLHLHETGAGVKR